MSTGDQRSHNKLATLVPSVMVYNWISNISLLQESFVFTRGVGLPLIDRDMLSLLKTVLPII